MKRNTVKPQTDEVLLTAMDTFRRFSKKTGPNDNLQTREFKEVVDHVKAYEKSHPATLTKEESESYLLYHFIRHYQESLSVLNELSHTPKKVLEIGSGSGPFALAALMKGANDVTMADSNRYALELGADLIAKQGFPVTLRYWSFPENHLPEGKFDLIAFPYSLREVTNNSFDMQEKLIAHCATRLTDDGIMVFIDRSEPASNKHILMLRDRFQQENRQIIAPCIWTGKCPALESKVTCFAQRAYEKPALLGKIQSASSINSNSLKFSYLIVAYHKKAAPMPSRPLYRVVSPALTIHNQKRYMLCGIDGKKMIGTQMDEVPQACRAFEFLERGAVVEVEHARETSAFLDLEPDSSLKVIAAPGKPLIL